jgi:methylated-DNA-[protein]-cysteine S-methyltransferase
MPSRVDKLSPFAQRVLSALRRIPPGHVTTYGDLAAIAGRPRAARAVGTIMRHARVPGLPYHRVIAAGGRVGGYGGAPGMKAALLVAEGLIVRRLRVLHFDAHRWTTRAASRRSTRGNAGPRPRRLTR